MAVAPDSGLATTTGQTIAISADTTGIGFGDHWGSVVMASASDTATLVLRFVSPPAPPAFITQWGSSGIGNGQFDHPGGITVDAAGNVYVADTFNHRIQKFASDGAYLTSAALVAVTVIGAMLRGWRAGRMRQAMIASGSAVVAWLLALFVVWEACFGEMDRCLDSGGVWNEKLRACEGERAE